MPGGPVTTQWGPHHSPYSARPGLRARENRADACRRGAGITAGPAGTRGGRGCRQRATRSALGGAASAGAPLLSVGAPLCVLSRRASPAGPPVVSAFQPWSVSRLSSCDIADWRNSHLTLRRFLGLGLRSCLSGNVISGCRTPPGRTRSEPLGDSACRGRGCWLHPTGQRLAEVANHAPGPRPGGKRAKASHFC